MCCVGSLSIMLFDALFTNYLNFLINKNNDVFYGIVGVLPFSLGDLAILSKFLRSSEPIGSRFQYTLQPSLFGDCAHAVWPLMMYVINFKFIRKGFYLDDTVSKKAQKVNCHRFELDEPFWKYCNFFEK